MALAPGTVLGQYVIRSPLGAGGMGEVYRAHDTRLDREVAIKVLPASLTTDPERLRRFEQEARAAAALNHPNILAVYQMATEHGVSYLVSELLEGESLRERLAHGAIPLRKAVDYGVQIAHGLAAAHERGIVHRDLKPENLFVTRTGRVKILDFGLAKLMQPKEEATQEATRSQSTEPGVVMGTTGYMSPEQVRGKPADHRADIFAFGTVLYEMVTGKQPFRRPTSAESMTAILREEPPAISQLAPSVPPGLQRVVHRCLEKNPEQRFQSASDLAFALEALSDSAIVPVSAVSTPGQPRSRPLRPALGVLFVLLALTAWLGFWLTRPSGVLRVTHYAQLTHDGRPKVVGGEDGSRLYLFWGTPLSAQGVAEMSVLGGEPKTLPIVPAHMNPRAVSPNGLDVLLVEGQGVPLRGPMWSMPLLGGSLRRLGNIEGQDAAWSPDGKWLAYGDGSDLMVAKADGSEPRRLTRVKDLEYVMKPVWSPDQTHVRFTRLSSGSAHSSSMWEVSAEGKDLRPLLPGWQQPDDCCGQWTADGKYFVFQARGQIWALPKRGAVPGSTAKPIQLTWSPMSLFAPIPSKDGKSLFCVGATTRGELLRYDGKEGRFTPYLAGISAEYAAFSKDGQWVTYVSFPEGALWRSKADGSEGLQLTFPPNHIVLPRWSPDGKTIVFSVVGPDRTAKLYSISREGGSPQRLLPGDPGTQKNPTWSPDGSKIAFGGNGRDPQAVIQILDVASRNLTALPGSQGLYSPRWAPNGRSLVAISSDQRRLLLYTFQTQQWTLLATGTPGWPNWSHDSQYVYVMDGAQAGTVIRIRLSDRKQERVVDLKNFVATGYYGGALALTPDDAPLLMRDAGTYDVYALDWKTP